jgi:ABC-type Na+ efflux pump permease subunit
MIELALTLFLVFFPVIAMASLTLKSLADERRERRERKELRDPRLP